ncbi:unnamed protein product [Cylindrotheca closterium]|uniref:G-protein coupled receptors family 2 profile 2 domain-containing protein n=1 Tax=Cylindrotheca closterium TaxID=2856 RepID=A0AAD2FPM2_9STRA|nr:unnamed protein product [Cylindrotheca closterium]
MSDRPLMYMPSPGMQAFLSLIGIPMSFLSIIGSYHIIRHTRTGNGHSAYRQIMMVSSVCDIIWSAAFVFQPFLSDNSLEFQHEDELWIWSFGNSASCTFLGAMTQFGLSAHWYAGLLSLYFVSTVKFGVKQATFAKILPFLQGFIIFWSVGTALTAAAMKRIHPLGPSPGCWVAGDGFCVGDDCDVTVLLGWMIGGIPTILMLVCVIVNNLILYWHVRSIVKEGQRRSMQSQMELSTYSSRTRNAKRENPPGRSNSFESNDMSVSSSSVSHTGEVQSFSRYSSRNSNGKGAKPGRSSLDSTDMAVQFAVSQTGEVHSFHGNSQKSFISRLSDGSVFTNSGSSVLHQKNSVLRSSKKQWKRVQEVGKQSFLYVGAYLLSFGWTFIINFLDSQNYEFKENAANLFLPLLVCQSLLLPSMGFFNFCVYFRPKIRTVSKKYPNESRVWCIRRVIYGNAIKPSPAADNVRPSALTPGSAIPEKPPASLRLDLGGPDAMSSLARCDSDGAGSVEMISNDDVEMKPNSLDCSVIMEGSVEESIRRSLRESGRASTRSGRSGRTERSKNTKSIM